MEEHFPRRSHMDMNFKFMMKSVNEKETELRTEDEDGFEQLEEVAFTRIVFQQNQEPTSLIITVFTHHSVLCMGAALVMFAQIKRQLLLRTHHD